MGDLILGVHSKLKSDVLDNKRAAKSLSQAIQRDIDELGLNACQIFTYGPRVLKENNVDYDEVKKVCEDIDLSVHSAYATTGIWQVRASNYKTAQSKKQLSSFEKQFRTCKKAGAWGFVLHINKISPEHAAETIQILRPIAIKHKTTLLIEMVSSCADATTYETPAKLNKLVDLLGVDNYYGLTVDTAHLWGAGVDVREYATMAAWFRDLKYPEQIKQFHLNGSSVKLGSGKDVHEAAFSPDDVIWRNYHKRPEQSGVKAVIDFAKKYRIPVICEINRGAEKDIRASLEIIKNL